MWWEPRSGAEADLRATVDRLVERYHAYLAELGDGRQLIFGVGTQFVAQAPAVPAVYLAADLLAASELPSDGPITVRFFGGLTGESLVTEVLRDWDLPAETALVPTYPVERGSGTFTPTRGGARVASPSSAWNAGRIGLQIDGGSSGSWLLTAGHVLAPGDDGALSTLADPLGQQLLPIGRVADRSDPADIAPLAGWDIAAIVSDAPIQPTVHAGLATPPPFTSNPVNVVAHDGSTTGVFGILAGTITQGGDKNRQWRCCWAVGFQPSLVRGDSGCLVTGQYDDLVYGHFVGGAAFGGQGPFLQHWVQDIRALVTDVAPDALPFLDRSMP